jgi:hypothetical protein
MTHRRQEKNEVSLRIRAGSSRGEKAKAERACPRSEAEGAPVPHPSLRSGRVEITVERNYPFHKPCKIFIWHSRKPRTRMSRTAYGLAPTAVGNLSVLISAVTPILRITTVRKTRRRRRQHSTRRMVSPHYRQNNAVFGHVRAAAPTIQRGQPVASLTWPSSRLRVRESV